MELIGVCLDCNEPLHYLHPCKCVGDYNIGDIFERKIYEYTILTKLYDIDSDGKRNECVYMVKEREIGKDYYTYIIVYDGHFRGYKKVKGAY